MLVPLRCAALVLAPLWLLACGDEEGADASDPVPAGDDGSPAEPVDDAPAPEPAPVAEPAPPPDDEALPEPLPKYGMDPPDNVSFESAREVAVGDGNGVLQAVLSDEQVDYFSFEGEAGAFYVLETNRGAFTPDNVMTLHGPDQQALAENDYGARWVGEATDTRLLVRLREDGTHFVVLEDRVTPALYFEAPDAPVLFYRFTIDRIDADSSGVTFAGDDAAPSSIEFVEDDSSGFRYTTLVGTPVEATTDLFDFEGADALALIGHANEGGVTGNGSTGEGGVLELFDAQDRLVARIDRAQGQLDIHPPVSEQAYRFSVQATEPSGDNDFYAIDLVLLPDNPTELDEALNDATEGAQEIVMSDGLRRRGLLLSVLQPGDVDHYRFEAHEGELLLASCEARSAGSGVLGLSAELFDPEGETLAVARETDSEALLMDEITAPADGSHVLRLESTGLHSEVFGDWVRCVVLAEPDR